MLRDYTALYLCPALATLIFLRLANHHLLLLLVVVKKNNTKISILLIGQISQLEIDAMGRRGESLDEGH